MKLLHMSARLALVALAAACSSKSERPPVVKGASSSESAAPVEAVDLALEDAYGCLRAPDGAVRCWGRNDSGQVGDGTEIPNTPFSNVRTGPVPVKGVVGAGELHASSSLSWVVHPDGQVSAWGTYQYYDRTATRGWRSLVPKRWELPPAQQVVVGSSFHCVLLRDTNAVACAGLGDDPSLDLVPAPISTAAELVAVGSDLCARTQHGAVTCVGRSWGKDLGIDERDDHLHPSSAPPSGGAPPHPQDQPRHKIDRAPVTLALSNIASLAGGFRTMCAIDREGAAWCWSTEAGTLPSNPTPTKLDLCGGKIKTLAVGEEVCGVLADGNVCCRPSRYGDFTDLARLKNATHLAVRPGRVCGLVDHVLRCAGGSGADERTLFDAI